MGIYLNPGSKGFEESVKSEIYVDKTGLIAYTNQILKTKVYMYKQTPPIW